MVICGVDFEATSTDPATARIIEIGAVSWNEAYIEKESASFLVWGPDYPRLTPDVVRVTGLTDLELANSGVGPKKSLEGLTNFLKGADFILAHNKAYDETLYLAECARHKIEPVLIPWYCTLQDVPYPQHFTCRRLSHLALDHGITVDPKSLHRAIGDVRLMGELLDRGAYTPSMILAYAKSPWVYLKALIPAPWEDGGVGKDRARKAGYSWEVPKNTTEPRFLKSWVKRIKEMELEFEKSQDHGFKREVVTPQ